jgi:hypothetical protein
MNRKQRLGFYDLGYTALASSSFTYLTGRRDLPKRGTERLKESDFNVRHLSPRPPRFIEKNGLSPDMFESAQPGRQHQQPRKR